MNKHRCKNCTWAIPVEYVCGKKSAYCLWYTLDLNSMKAWQVKRCERFREKEQGHENKEDV